MICVDLPIYQAKARKAQKFNAAPKVGPGFPLGVEPPRASANEPPRKTLTRRSWSVWLVTSSCCALCGDLVATTVRYLGSATRERLTWGKFHSSNLYDRDACTSCLKMDGTEVFPPAGGLATTRDTGEDCVPQ